MRSLRDKNLGMTNNSLAWNEQYSKPREHHRCWKGMCFLNLWEKTHRLRAWFSALAARCNHAVPGPGPGPSNQNLWAEARLGFLFLKALQVILKCNEGWTHYFKRKGYHRKIQQGTPRGYKWGAETPNNQVAAGVISVLIVIILIIITTAPMTSTDKPRIQVREEGEQRGDV